MQRLIYMITDYEKYFLHFLFTMEAKGLTSQGLTFSLLDLSNIFPWIKSIQINSHFAEVVLFL